MGRIVYRGLGQLGTSELTDTLEQRYRDLRVRCIESYGEDFCNAVLPRNLVYAVTREDLRPTVPWWGWMLMGAFVGRLLR